MQKPSCLCAHAAPGNFTKYTVELSTLHGMDRAATVHVVHNVLDISSYPVPGRILGNSCHWARLVNTMATRACGIRGRITHTDCFPSYTQTLTAGSSGSCWRITMRHGAELRLRYLLKILKHL